MWEQSEGSAGPAGGLCLISSEVYRPVEAVLLRAGVGESEVWGGACQVHTGESETPQQVFQRYSTTPGVS